jgi:uncharacterized membrane protein YccC
VSDHPQGARCFGKHEPQKGSSGVFAPATGDEAVSKGPSSLAKFRPLLFSAKTFGAAMMALYVSLALDLERPFWTVATVYIVSQPLTGALRSKALYRICGTLVGAAATVALIPNLVQAPEVLTVAVALWIAVCLYFAQLDRTPRSYFFILAGYTSALIGLPAVDDPGAIFDIALARVEEITLGLVCASVIGGVVFPGALAPVLSQRLDAWRRDAERWAFDALAGRGRDDASIAARRRLAADAVEINALAGHIAFDTSVWQSATRWVRMLQQRILTLLPILSALGDRVAALNAAGPLPAGLQPLLDEIAAWIRGAADLPRSEADRLRAAIDRLNPVGDAATRWDGFLLTSLLARLRNLIDVRQDCVELRHHVATGGGKLPAGVTLSASGEGEIHLHADRGMALLSAFAAFVTILTVCAIWIATAWPDGATAAAIAAVACCLTASADDPAPRIVGLVWASTVVLVVALIYQFAILPAVGDFPTLVLALAPGFLLIGVASANPKSASIGMLSGAILPSMMALQSSYAADLPALVNGGGALLSGLALAAIVTRLIRSVGTEWSCRRLLRAGWRDIAAAATRQGASTADRFVLIGRMLDRLGILVPRLALLGPGTEIAAADTLVDLQVGVCIIDLQRLRPALPLSLQSAATRLLDGVGAHFAGLAAGTASGVPPQSLLDGVDQALAAITPAEATEPVMRNAGLALVGIRRGLFPAAPPFAPDPQWSIAA